MSEMMFFAEAAGGVVMYSEYSTCWDEPQMRDGLLRAEPDQARNLVLVIGRDTPENRAAPKTLAPPPVTVASELAQACAAYAVELELREQQLVDLHKRVAALEVQLNRYRHHPIINAARFIKRRMLGVRG